MGVIRIEITTKDGRSRTLEFGHPHDLYPRQGIECRFCGVFCYTVGALVTHLADNCGETDLERAMFVQVEDRGHI